MLTYEALLPPALVIAGAIALLLSALLRMFPDRLSKWLPLGRSDFDQVAILTFIAFAMVTIVVETPKIFASAAATTPHEAAAPEKASP